MTRTIAGWLRGSEFIPLPELKQDGDIPVFTIDNIESEAEKLLKIRVEEIEPLMAQMKCPLTESDGEWMRERGLELCLVIRTLLAEKGIKYE